MSDEHLAELARVRALRMVSEAVLKAAGDRRFPDDVRERLGDVALDVLLELRDGPIGEERGLQLQRLLSTTTMRELGEPF